MGYESRKNIHTYYSSELVQENGFVPLLSNVKYNICDNHLRVLNWVG